MNARATVTGRARLVAISVAVLTMACAPFHSMSRSESSIRDRMLALTPVGTSIADVRSIYDERLAPDCRWQDLTALIYHPAVSLYAVVGARTGLKGCVGSYWNPASGLFTTYVYVEWVFNGKGKLVEVKVDKDVDVL